MKHSILLLTICILLTSFQLEGGIYMEKDEAQKALLLLNDIRTNPGKYHNRFSFSWSLKSKQALIWNDTLAAVAERKALDMATRNYFGHVDPDGYGMNYYIHKSGYRLNAAWIKDKQDNSFESIAAGPADGEDAISRLLIDEHTPSLGHRKHLLGLDEWNNSLVDIGIGFARGGAGSKYKTYVCVIIAKHDW